jgi:hypothetical protein
MSKRALATVYFILAVLPLVLGCPVVTAFTLPHWRSSWERHVMGVFGIASPDSLWHYRSGALIVLALMSVALAWYGLLVWFDRD